jgi:ribonuclease HI
MPFRSFPRKSLTNNPKSESLFESEAESKPESVRRSVGSDSILAHVDGGARGNPGPAGFGVHIEDAQGKMIAELSEYLGHKTNNYAEYSGLLAALEYAVKHGHAAIKVVSDSELMVKQLRGEYKVKSPELKELYDQARALIRKLEHFEIRHVLRAQNKDADRLANAAMDRGSGRAPSTASSVGNAKEVNGIVRGGVVELLGADLPEGALVKVRLKQ